MSNHGSSLGTRAGKAKPVRDVVEPAFQQNQQSLTGDAFGARGLGESAAKLFFEQAVHPLHFLLLAQLNTVFRKLWSALAMLSRRVVSSFDGALVRIAPLSLEKELHIFAPAKPAHRVGISSQSVFLL